MTERSKKGCSPIIQRIKRQFSSEKKLSDEDGEGVHMRRNMSLMGGVSMVAGTMIGSGIFISPKGVLRNSGSIGACLIIWVACGIISILGAFSYAELGTLIPQSGGEYAYYLETFSRYGAFFGPLPAYMYVWSTVMFNKPSSLCVICLSISTYSLQPFFGSCTPPTLAVKLLAGVFIVLVTALNCLSVEIVTKLQNFFLVAKVLSLLVIIGGGIAKLSQGSVKYLNEGFEDTIQVPSLLAGAFFSGLFAYEGWNNLNYAVEEIKNPRRNLPLAIMISISLVMFCYVLTNVSYFTVLSKEEFLSTDAVAVSWAKHVLGGASIIIPVAVSLSALGAANGSCFTAGRLTFAAARDGHLPGIFEMIHVQRLTPIPPLLWNAFLALIYLIIGDIYTLIESLSLLIWFFFGVSMVSLLIVQRRFKGDKRQKLPAVVPVIFLVITTALCILPVSHNPHLGYLSAILLTLAGIIPYIPFVYLKIRIPLVGRITRWLQLLLNVVPTDYVKKMQKKKDDCDDCLLSDPTVAGSAGT